MLRAAPAQLVCPFQRGVRYPLSSLDAYLSSIEETRTADSSFSKSIGLSGNREVHALYDELYPLRIFARHMGMVHAAHFEWQAGGRDENGVDFVISAASWDRSLQITTTGPIWPEALPPYDNPGYQHRLLRELLNRQEHVSGRGPWERKGREINGGYDDFTSADRDLAFHNGILAAYARKRKHRGTASELVGCTG
jgi:hypothetical protein